MLEDHVTYKHSSFPQALFIFHVFEHNSYYLEKRAINRKSFFPANLILWTKSLHQVTASMAEKGTQVLPSPSSVIEAFWLWIGCIFLLNRNAAARPVLTGNIKHMYIHTHIYISIWVTWHSTPMQEMVSCKNPPPYKTFIFNSSCWQQEGLRSLKLHTGSPSSITDNCSHLYFTAGDAGVDNALRQHVIGVMITPGLISRCS